jgi:hypothetical protein
VLRAEQPHEVHPCADEPVDGVLVAVVDRGVVAAQPRPVRRAARRAPPPATPRARPASRLPGVVPLTRRPPRFGQVAAPRRRVNATTRGVTVDIGWVVFGVVVATLLVLDLGVFHRRAKEATLKSAILWSVFWVSLGVAFSGYVFATRGADLGWQYLGAFVLEKALSVDNLFVISVVFTVFKVPRSDQHRVLFWGILGALVTRGLFVVLGVELIHRFEWTLYLMGAFLIYTGLKLLRPKEEDDEEDPTQNLVARLATRSGRFRQRTARARVLHQEGRQVDGHAAAARAARRRGHGRRVRGSTRSQRCWASRATSSSSTRPTCSRCSGCARCTRCSRTPWCGSTTCRTRSPRSSCSSAGRCSAPTSSTCRPKRRSRSS